MDVAERVGTAFLHVGAEIDFRSSLNANTPVAEIRPSSKVRKYCAATSERAKCHPMGRGFACGTLWWSF